jgi:hypothetical protein
VEDRTPALAEFSANKDADAGQACVGTISDEPGVEAERKRDFVRGLTVVVKAGPMLP